MDYKCVNLVYFTGTGGTVRVADAFEQAFFNRSIDVHRTELNKKDQPVDIGDLLMVIFPVYAFNTPKSIDEWIKQVPPGQGKPTAVISVSGGGEISPNTACRAATNYRLNRKGYHIVYEKMFVMPSNFMIKYDDILCAMLLGVAPKNAEKAVSEILAGNCHRTTPFWIDRVVSKLGALEKIDAKFFGKYLKVNGNCINCGWCAQNCPRGNITIVNDKITFGDICVICLRCVYGCPQKAIEPGIGKFIIFRDGFDLNKIEKKTGYMTVFPPVEQVTEGSLLKGVKAYLIESGEK